MEIHNNILYITYSELVFLGFNERTVRRQEGIKDPNDKRKILIEYDRLRDKYKQEIATSLCEGYDPYEYYQIQLDREEKEFKAKALSQEKEEIRQKLQKALDEDYVAFISTYNIKLANYKKAQELAKLHASYSVILSVVGEKKTKKGSIQKVYEVLQELDIPKKPNDYKIFSKYINQCRKNGIESYVLHGNIGNKSSKVFTDYQFSLMEAYAALPNMYSREMIAYLVNVHSDEANLKKVSISTVKTYLCNPKIKNRIALMRRGGKNFEDTILPYTPRTEEMFAGNLWMMDGTPLQFYCWDDNFKKRIRLNFFAIIDVFSKKIVGFDISISEDRFNVINALKMAFKIHGHLPKEILHDNFSANKTDEIKNIKYQLEKSGVVFRAARPKNAKDKAHIERYFGTVQSTLFSLYDDYMGEGITSKRVEARPDKDHTRKAVKKADMSMTEMKTRIAKIVGMYNDLKTEKKESPILKYKTSPKPNITELNNYEIPFLFWNRKSITIRNSMVQIVVKKQKYYFEIYDHDLKLELNGVTVDVRYDEKDLGTVHLFNQATDEFICECKEIYKPQMSSASQTEKDVQEIINQSAKVKSFKKHVDKSHKEAVAKGIKGHNAESVQLLDPLTTDKYNVNSLESQEMDDIYFDQEGIDDTKVNLLKSQLPRPIYYADPTYTKGQEEKELKTVDVKVTAPKIYKRKTRE